MTYKITKVELWILRWIAARIVRASHVHTNNIVDYYRVIALACREEFTEDNKPTLVEFLTECHRASLDDAP